MISSEKYKLLGISSYTTYESGQIKECKLNEQNILRVGNQDFIPRYSDPDERRKDNKALALYESGNVKSIALEERTVVMTSIGSIPVELLTFYEDGAVKSLFPLNGQISFGWSEEEEEKLLEEMQFDLACARFTTKIIGARFYNSGVLKSLILWSGKRIEIDTPIGRYPVRVGFRLYEDGSLESFEPAVPVLIKTAIGAIMAFDQNALGMDADFNSIRFYPDGRLKALCTNSDIVINQISSSQRTIMYQQLRLDMLSNEMVKLPVIISFGENQVEIDNGAEKQVFSISDSKFLFLYDGSYRANKCSPGSDCSGCSASCM